MNRTPWGARAGEATVANRKREHRERTHQGPGQMTRRDDDESVGRRVAPVPAGAVRDQLRDETRQNRRRHPARATTVSPGAARRVCGNGHRHAGRAGELQDPRLERPHGAPDPERREAQNARERARGPRLRPHPGDRQHRHVAPQMRPRVMDRVGRDEAPDLALPDRITVEQQRVAQAGQRLHHE